MALIGGSALLTSGCASLPVVKTALTDKKLSVPASSFLETTAVIVRNKDQEYDILLVKKADGTYNALQMKCTHRDVSLNGTTKGLNCNEHGSRFDLEGKVVEGPAKRDLKTYFTSVSGDNILISV